MADRLSSDDETVTSKHNVRHRAEAIVGSFEEMYEIDRKIAVLSEKHLKDLRERKSELKKHLREDYNMPAPLVSARYYGYRVERKAVESSDNVTLDAIREMYEYLPVGGVIPTADDVEQANGEPSAVRSKAFQEGYRAGQMGAAGNSNPFARKKERTEWDLGHQAAQGDQETSGDAVDGGERRIHDDGGEFDAAALRGDSSIEAT